MPDATERKVLAASAFIAALMLFPLGGRVTQVKQVFDRVSALSALALAALLLAYHLWASRREAEAAPKAAPTAAPASLGADPAPPPTLSADSVAAPATADSLAPRATVEDASPSAGEDASAPAAVAASPAGDDASAAQLAEAPAPPSSNGSRP